MRQTILEVVDQGRVIAIEDAMAALIGEVDHDAPLEEIAADVAEGVRAAVPCAEVTELTDVALRVAFASGIATCNHAGVAYNGTLRVVYTRPRPEGLLVTIYYEPLTGDGTSIDGFSQLTWHDDGSARLVTEVRIDADSRAIEVQSDRLLQRQGSAARVDGWRRWQTLMGRWELDIAAFVYDAPTLTPASGLGVVATPFDHQIVLDFAVVGGSAQIRANGGRRDRIFEVTPDGEVVDQGDG